MGAIAWEQHSERFRTVLHLTPVSASVIDNFFPISGVNVDGTNKLIVIQIICLVAKHSSRLIRLLEVCDLFLGEFDVKSIYRRSASSRGSGEI